MSPSFIDNKILPECGPDYKNQVKVWAVAELDAAPIACERDLAAKFARPIAGPAMHPCKHIHFWFYV